VGIYNSNCEPDKKLTFDEITSFLLDKKGWSRDKYEEAKKYHPALYLFGRLSTARA
jgi:hypothetical protein